MLPERRVYIANIISQASIVSPFPRHPPATTATSMLCTYVAVRSRLRSPSGSRPLSGWALELILWLYYDSQPCDQRVIMLRRVSAGDMAGERPADDSPSASLRTGISERTSEWLGRSCPWVARPLLASQARVVPIVSRPLSPPRKAHGHSPSDRLGCAIHQMMDDQRHPRPGSVRSVAAQPTHLRRIGARITRKAGQG